MFVSKKERISTLTKKLCIEKRSKSSLDLAPSSILEKKFIEMEKAQRT